MLPLEILYFLSAVMLAAYGFNSAFLTWLFWRYKQQSSQESCEQTDASQNQLSPQDTDTSTFPMVTVQLPIYNERHVTKRLIEASVALDWPADRLQVQVLDDSTDDTTEIVAGVLMDIQTKQTGKTICGIEHVRRPTREGYKAGALAYGMDTAKGEYIVIFDADFVPTSSFLRQTIPYFADATIGCVQTRWGHINPTTSPLTQAQALGIDGHFRVEQYVRDQLGAFLNFNGTAGVWRRTCMEDAGGWEGDTLTEDLDLSYRAQLRGWRMVYQPDVVVPAELPVQVDAFKRQQFRWAKGSFQTAIKLLRQVWSANEPTWRKALGTLHLTNYLVHPLMLLNLLLLLPMTSSQSIFLKIAPFLTTAAIGPPIMYWTALTFRDFSGFPDAAGPRGKQRTGETLWSKIRQLGILMALGTGLSINNTRAVYEAVAGVYSEFKRTPKFAVTSRSTNWQSSTYALPRNPIVWIELALSCYATWLLVYCIAAGIWWMVGWVFLYAIGYGYISGLAFLQSWQLRMARKNA
ncbi:MAG: glycosyltransferase [Chloroflexota bacterium]